ncbi:hypothetical protein BG004_006840 [Podila humilis]|nr:hypothetical protein BG004_006840 [Podila humilis]
MVTRCKTSRGIFSDFPTGQPSPTTSPRSSIFSMGLKSPTFSQKRISAKVAPKTRRSCTNLTKASRLSLSPSEIRTLNLKEEYNSDKDEERRKKEEASFATTINDQRCSKGALRRSRSKLQRLDHGELTTEIRSPNGLANTPKTRTFNDWKKALMSAGADADTDVDVEVYAGCIGIGGDSKSESEVRKMKRASDPQGIIPPQGGQHHQRLRHPIEIRLEQRELMVRQLKTFVKDRMALEDQFWEADKVLRKYEAENEDYEAKYQELCKELALVKNSLKNGDMYQVT